MIDPDPTRQDPDEVLDVLAGASTRRVSASALIERVADEKED